MSESALIADIGGTKIRFARARADGSFDSVNTAENPEAGDLVPLLRDALDRCGPQRPQFALLAVAGPVDGDRIALTNRPWSFSQDELRRALNLERLVVVNDFSAQAHALPAMQPGDFVQVSGGKGPPNLPMLVCGPGTGFGAGLLVPHERGPIALPSEAGHMRLAAATADEARVVAYLVREEGPVSVEQVLSGPGLSRLHRILTGGEKSPHEVLQAAQHGDTAARETVHVFLRLFGRIAGDLVLAFDARGGLFITGGLGQALAPLFAASPFQQAFEDHPPYRARLAAVPVYVIVHPEPGLLGAAALARSMFEGG